jgi:hypothetical protein
MTLRMHFVSLGMTILALGAGCTSSSSECDFECRKDALFEETIAAPSSNTYSEVMRLERGVAPDEARIQHDLDRMNDRIDTADFKLPGLLWILYKHADSELLSEEILRNTKQAILDFKYWPDELLTEADAIDTDNMVYWTENHFILFASGAYLAGQLYPDEVFPASGETGAERMEKFRPRIMRWLELRYQSGFTEWLSNVYYDEDIPALVALIELAEDDELRALSTMVLDLILADMALHHFDGNFGSTHGRTYEQKMSGKRDSTRSTLKLMFGLNDYSVGNMSSASLAISTTYQMPQVLYDILHDQDRPEFENRQRHSIRIEDAELWGLDTTLLEDGMTFLTLEAYTHPDTIGLFVEMLDAYKWWEHSDFAPFKDFQRILYNPEARDGLARAEEKDITRNMRPEVHAYTYRTPDYMLSTAQDWRPGYGGDQQSIWQATLGLEAVAFTTHPGNEKLGGDTPRYWTGYGTMPRAVQVENVVMSLYDVDTDMWVYVSDQPLYTHAFLPQAKFDEIGKENGWFFARKDDGFLALWTSDPDADWVPNDNPDEADFGDYEIIANGEKTIWICEVARASDYGGSFQAFKEAISTAPLQADPAGLTIRYLSPSQGELVMAWEGPVTQDGNEVSVRDFGRYENPYANAGFPAEAITFEHGGESLVLGFDGRSRQVSSFIK